MNKWEIAKSINTIIIEDIFVSLFYLIAVIYILVFYPHIFWIICIAFAGGFFLRYTKELVFIIVDILQDNIVEDNGTIICSAGMESECGPFTKHQRILFKFSTNTILLKSKNNLIRKTNKVLRIRYLNNANIIVSYAVSPDIDI